MEQFNLAQPKPDFVQAQESSNTRTNKVLSDCRIEIIAAAQGLSHHDLALKLGDHYRFYAKVISGKVALERMLRMLIRLDRPFHFSIEKQPE